MGGISSLMGTAGGFGGSGVSAPEMPNIVNPVTSTQISDQYKNAQTGLQQQQDLLNALQGQNGIQNQSNVYNQLQGVANGTGPNPAQAMLNQATAANTANQAALMAGQRGAGSNPALIARQAAMQGAANQQNAAGQNATLQAQQSLGALGQLGNLATNQVGQQANAVNAYNQAAQGEQGQLLNAQSNYNNALVGGQSSVNQANAGIIGKSLSGQTGIFGGIGAGMAMGKAEGGLIQKYAGGTPDNTIQVLSSNAPATSAGPSSGFGKFLNAIGTNMSAGALAQDQQQTTPNAEVGKLIGKGIKKAYDYLNKPSIATGQGLQSDPLGVGSLDKSAAPAPGPAGSDPLGVGNLSGDAASNASAAGAAGTDAATGANALGGADMAADLGSSGVGVEDALAALAKGGKIKHYDGGGIIGDIMGLLPLAAALAKGGRVGDPVPAMVSPGEKYLNPRDVQKVKSGANPMEVGEKIPGKPKVGGAKNSYANDTVPKTLEEGGIVLPRSVTQSKHPHWAAHKFVSEIMKNKNKKAKK
jgi:hypothetical protein